MGMCFAMSSNACSFPLTTSRAICVSIRPGLIAFTRMPCLMYSRAAVRIRPKNAIVRCDVVADTRIAGQRANRPVVDDRAAALAFHLPQFVLHAAPHATQVNSDH